jgi:SAM-dependent methyltransferase
VGARRRALADLVVSTCRSCGAPLRHSVVDLGAQPLANAYPGPADLGRPDPVYPLHPFVCDRCWLMQIEEAAKPDEIFSDYAYFSSFSDSWLEHARLYAERMIGELGLGPESQVVEIASNDGYLLRNFVEHGIPVRGVEPARNVAAAAIESGIPTEVVFLGRASAERLQADGLRADLLIGNNVLAHVPDLNDFVAGLATLLAPDGTLTMEFPHVLHLLEESQFDTIYHEHFSYLSLIAVRTAFARHGLAVTAVEEIPTHGGSLRVFAGHTAAGKAEDASVAALDERERARGLTDVATYQRLGAQAERVKRELLDFLASAKAAGERVVAYGAPAKGNTLLNYVGVDVGSIAYTVDRSPHKQGLFLPGSRLPIHAPERIFEDQPDYVLILPWNLRDEIAGQMAAVRDWGGRFVVPIPQVTVF